MAGANRDIQQPRAENVPRGFPKAWASGRGTWASMPIPRPFSLPIAASQSIRNGSARVCVFWVTPRTISRFDATRGLTNLKSKIEHDRALAGGLLMGAHSSLIPARSTLGLAPSLRCDHCREELGRGVHRYWHMQFCSAACMTAYQRRLAPETKVKISQLQVLLESSAAA